MIASLECGPMLFRLGMILHQGPWNEYSVVNLHLYMSHPLNLHCLCPSLSGYSNPPSFPTRLYTPKLHTSDGISARLEWIPPRYTGIMQSYLTFSVDVSDDTFLVNGTYLDVFLTSGRYSNYISISVVDESGSQILSESLDGFVPAYVPDSCIDFSKCDNHKTVCSCTILCDLK